jgi:threonine/homoserine/homoserine lactone efflux protein
VGCEQEKEDERQMSEKFERMFETEKPQNRQKATRNWGCAFLYSTEPKIFFFFLAFFLSFIFFSHSSSPNLCFGSAPVSVKLASQATVLRHVVNIQGSSWFVRGILHAGLLDGVATVKADKVSNFCVQL